MDIIENNDISSKYLDTLCLHGTLPAFNYSTYNKTYLDHLINKTKLQASCYGSESFINDHYFTYIILETNTQIHKQSYKTISRINYKKLEIALKSISPI